MSDRKRIYMDHAATSWPKSESVITAMIAYMRDCGAAAGRGSYASAAAASSIVHGLRIELARLVGADDARRVSFHCNGTAALNAAIHGVLRPGDHVITTAAEHNSVLRPLYHCATENDVRVTVVPVDRVGVVDPADIKAEICAKTRLVAVNHASNVTGAVQSISEIGGLVADSNVLFLCDAAQSLGILPVDVTEMQIDLLAAPGHKGCGGPLGTGMLYRSPRTDGQIVPTVQGGTGSISESLEMPTDGPESSEAGNLNVPALAGWLAALKADDRGTINERRDRAAATANLLRRSFAQVAATTSSGSGIPERLTLVGCDHDLPVLSLQTSVVSCHELATILDVEFGIEARAGLHCAPLIHHAIEGYSELPSEIVALQRSLRKTAASNEPTGTLRLSCGPDTSPNSIEYAAQAVQSVIESFE